MISCSRLLHNSRSFSRASAWTSHNFSVVRSHQRPSFSVSAIRHCRYQSGQAAERTPTKSRLRVPEKDIFKLTDNARNQVRSLWKDSTAALRINTKAGGCNGWRYVMEFVDTIPEGDEVVRDHSGLTIAVAPRALLAVVGTEMDYVSDDLKSEFVFQNPNAIGECGCGESFNLSENSAFMMPTAIKKEPSPAADTSSTSRRPVELV